MKDKLNYRSAPLPLSGGKPSTLNEADRSVEVVAATENPVEVFDWKRLDLVNETLLMSGLEMPKSRQIPLLDNHSRYATAAILGSFREMSPRDGQLVGRAFFSTVPEAEGPFTKVKEGHLTDFSIGYRVIESEWIPTGKTSTVKGRSFTGPLSVVTRWRVKELSTVPIGADEDTKARSESKGANEMENEAIEQARVEERERVSEIYAMCKRFDCVDLSDELIRSGASMTEAKERVFSRVETRMKEKEKERRHFPPFDHPAFITRDEADKRAAAIVDGLALRAGFQLEKPAPGADEYRHASLVDIAKESLLASGVKARGMSRYEVVREALNQRAAATGDFPSLLAGTVGKVLRLAYEENPASYELWVNQVDAADFKEMSRVQLSEAPGLEEVPEHGVYRYGSFGESKEVYQIATYGKLFAITRQAIINDDLGAFTRVPRAFSMAAKRLVNAAVYSVLTANSAMSDGINLFDGGHSNVGTGAAPGTGSLSEGRVMMRLQTGLKGEILNIAPRFLIVPAALETTADELLNSFASLEDNKNAGVINPFYRKLELITESILDASSTTAWYLVADPKAIDTVELAWLDGNRGPYLETRTGWTVDGVEYKVRVDFGAKAIDWRGLFYNAGA